MADNEQGKEREAGHGARQTGEAVLREAPGTGAAALCKHCGAALDPDLPFCPNCGEKVGGEERTCEFCETTTSKAFCPRCGRRVFPIPCPQCGSPSIADACEHCGTILNPLLQVVAAQTMEEVPESGEPEKMSAQEAARISGEFKALEAEESAEFRAFQKKLLERQILLEERDYFNKREKRIIKAFGSRPFTLELPDPREEAFRMRAYAALEKTVIEKAERAIQAELEQLFPEPPPLPDPPPLKADTEAEERRLAEIEENRREMEKRFSDLVSRVEGEVDAFRKEEERRRIEEERRRLEEERKRLEEERRKAEEERKRKEEEARRRAEEARRKAEEERRKAEEERERLREIERRRLEEERYRNRFLGTYYWEGHGGMLKIRIRFTSPSSANCLYVCTVCGEHHIRYRVDTDGNAITLASKSRSGDNCTWSDYQLVGHFTGGINSAGTQISGYWFNYINKGETVTLVKI